MEILFNRVFYKEKYNFFSLKKSFSLLSSGIQATDPFEGNR
jgi:hypothetical protein